MNNALGIVFGFIVVMVLLGWIASALTPDTRGQVSPQDRARHRTDGDGHIYYRNQDGQLIHECDGCAGCTANRAEELRRQGYEVEHVPGRRNSGQL